VIIIRRTLRPLPRIGCQIVYNPERARFFAGLTTGAFRARFTVIASNDNNHHADAHESDVESAISGASADILRIEAAYHDGLVAGVAAMGLVAPVRPEHRDLECHRAFQAGLAAGIRERREMIVRLFLSGVFSSTVP
jgi:hypothetical protein